MSRWAASPALTGATVVLTMAGGHGSYGWYDLAVVCAVLAGIFLAGLHGDVVVGAVICGIATFAEAVAGVTARALRRLTPAPRRRTSLGERRAASVGGRLR